MDLVSGLLANIQALARFKNGMELMRFDSVTGYGRIICNCECAGLDEIYKIWLC